MTTKADLVIAHCMAELREAREGDQLETINQRCARLGVSTGTVGRAMRVPIEAGLVTSVQGGGGGYFKAAVSRQGSGR